MDPDGFQNYVYRKIEDFMHVRCFLPIKPGGGCGLKGARDRSHAGLNREISQAVREMIRSKVRFLFSFSLLDY
jgi:hypothetical protein